MLNQTGQTENAQGTVLKQNNCKTPFQASKQDALVQAAQPSSANIVFSSAPFLRTLAEL